MAAVHASQHLEALEVAGMALFKLAEGDALYHSRVVQPQQQILREAREGNPQLRYTKDWE